jgi:hypothetical protein
MKTCILLFAVLITLNSCEQNDPDLSIKKDAIKTIDFNKSLKFNGSLIGQLRFVQVNELDKNLSIVKNTLAYQLQTLSSFSYDTIVICINEFNNDIKNNESLIYSTIDTLYNITNTNPQTISLNNSGLNFIIENRIDVHLLYLKAGTNVNNAGYYKGVGVGYDTSNSIIKDISLVSGSINADGEFQFLIEGIGNIKVIKGINFADSIFQASAFDKDNTIISEIFSHTVNPVYHTTDSLIINLQTDQLFTTDSIKYISLHFKK